MRVNLVLLASSTALDIAADKGGQARPPEFGCNELTGFKEAGMTSRFMIMAPFEDSTVEGSAGT